VTKWFFVGAATPPPKPGPDLTTVAVALIKAATGGRPYMAFPPGACGFNMKIEPAVLPAFEKGRRWY